MPLKNKDRTVLIDVRNRLRKIAKAPYSATEQAFVTEAIREANDLIKQIEGLLNKKSL